MLVAHISAKEQFNSLKKKKVIVRIILSNVDIPGGFVASCTTRVKADKGYPVCIINTVCMRVLLVKTKPICCFANYYFLV